MPKDARPLLDTPRQVKIVPMGPHKKGEFWYNGVEKCIVETFGLSVNRIVSPIMMNFNMDGHGLPIYKSSKYEFWPILATIENHPEVSPLIVAIYFGQGKPTLTEYLAEFVAEMKVLMENGITINGHHFGIGIRCIVCDAPARAYIKGTYYLLIIIILSDIEKIRKDKI